MVPYGINSALYGFLLDKDSILFKLKVVHYSDLQAPDTETVRTVNPRNRDKAKPAGQTKLATS